MQIKSKQLVIKFATDDLVYEEGNFYVEENDPIYISIIFIRNRAKEDTSNITYVHSVFEKVN